MAWRKTKTECDTCYYREDCKLFKLTEARKEISKTEKELNSLTLGDRIAKKQEKEKKKEDKERAKRELKQKQQDILNKY